MIISTLTDSAHIKFYIMCGFCWAVGKERFHSDSGPVQLANLTDVKIAHLERARRICAVASVGNCNSTLGLSREDAS